MAVVHPEQLVRDDAVHGSIYTNPEVFELEMERIFSTSWVYLAHESEVANRGDYKTTVIGRQPVIITRGADDGEIRVLFNRCRHRAASVCQQETGNANYFRCAYHGWTYKNSGELVGVPFHKGYGPDFNKCELGLIPVPRVGIYQGFIFASLAEDGPSLEEHLGGAKPYIDKIANESPEGIRLSAGIHKTAFNGNWKLQIENSIDPYHFSFVHESFLDMLGTKQQWIENISRSKKWETIALGNGHSVWEFGGNLGIGTLTFNLIVYPNLAFIGVQVREVRPRAVNRTETFIYPILLNGVSDEENAKRLREHERFYGPAGFGQPDDIEVAFMRVQEGLQADRANEWMLMAQGLHGEREENGMRFGTGATEVQMRGFYRQWQKDMARS